LRLSPKARPANSTSPRSDTCTNTHRTLYPGHSPKARITASPIASLDQPERISVSQLRRMAMAEADRSVDAPERPSLPSENQPPSPPTRSKDESAEFASFLNSSTLARELSLLADYVKQ
jgi:hypothetical protein